MTQKIEFEYTAVKGLSSPEYAYDVMLLLLGVPTMESMLLA